MNFILSLAGVALVRVLELIEFALLLSAILSWLPNSGDNPLRRILRQITEPVLAPIRRLLERTALGRNSMIDISPIIAWFLIDIIANFVASLFHVNKLFF